MTIVIRVVLKLFAFIALLAIIPLGLLEFFSNYAWICFTDNKYCESGVSETQLQNDHSLIIIGFFTCASILGFYKRMVKTPPKVQDIDANAKVQNTDEDTGV